ncbi:uncharacterized protein [Littorina saxatilis]|uniref:uncharacterized protein n=1 Tax=Littorina saxatilis TaxID=31220 RepID=UPI0038B48419
MNLLCLALFGVVATATAQNASDFLVIAEDAEENDLDLEGMKKLEEDGTVMKYVKMLLDIDSASSLKKAGFKDQPAAYEAIMGGKTAMFDNSSATNQAKVT